MDKETFKLVYWTSFVNTICILIYVITQGCFLFFKKVFSNVVIMIAEILNMLQSSFVVWVSSNFELLLYELGFRKKKYSSSIQKILNYSIRKKCNWEINSRLTLAPEMSPTQDSGVLLLGLVLMCILCKRKTSNHQLMDNSHYKTNLSRMLYSRKIKNTMKKLRYAFNSLCYLVNIRMETSNEFRCLTQMVSLLILLLMSGDIELNPGPYNDTELLAKLARDLVSVKSKYLEFGVQLGISIDTIESFKVDYNNDSGKILYQIIYYWLTNTPENLRFEKMCFALEGVDKKDLVHLVNFMKTAVPGTTKFTYNKPTFNTYSTTSEENSKVFSNIELSTKDEVILHREEKYTLYFRALQPDDKIFKSELQTDTIRIIDEFSKIRDGLYKYLKSNSDAVDELRWILQDWIHCGTIEKNDRHQNITRDGLEDISFIKLWCIFSSYCSFFNFRLLERAISVIEYENGVSIMQNYKTKFANYVKRRVTQCPSNIGMKGEDHVELFVKLDKPYANCRMEHLQKLGEDICQILKAEPEKLQLEGVQNGCICVIFHLHRSAIPNGFSLTQNQIIQFSGLRYDSAKILKLICGGEDFPVNFPYIDDADSRVQIQTKILSSVYEFREVMDIQLSMMNYNCSKMHYAANNGNVEDIKTAMQVINYNPTLLDENGNGALHCAVMREHLHVVKYLIEECNLDHKTLNASLCSLLHLAATRGNLQLVEYLMNVKHLSPISQDIHGWTPVHYATAAGHLEIVIMLSQNPDTREYLIDNFLSYNSIKYNICHVAVGQEHFKVAKYFLSKKIHLEDPLLLMLSVTNFNIMTYLLDHFEWSMLFKQCALFVGAYVGKVKSVAYLLDTQKCDPSIKNNNGNTPIHIAALHGQLNIIKYFMEHSICDPNLRGSNGWTPIHSACRGGHVEIIRYLVESRYSNPNERSQYQSAPIHIAALCGHLKVIKYFIEDLHVDSTIKGENDWTILHYACQNGFLEVIKYLIENQYIDLMIRNSDNVVPIHVAACNGRLNVIKYFLEDTNLNPGIKGQNDMTLLHYASQNGHLHITQYLIQNQCMNPMIKNSHNDTALHIASQCGMLPVMRYFIENLQQEPLMRGEDGWTLLHYTSEGGHIDAVKYLVEIHHLDPLIPDEHDTNSLHVAARNGRLQILKYFIEDQGCTLDVLGGNDYTLLHTACHYGQFDVIKFLVDIPFVNITAKDRYNYTPVHTAVMRNHFNIMKYFIEIFKYDPTVPGKNESTILHIASTLGFLDIVKYLVESCDCNPMIKNIHNNAPPHLAARHGKLQVVKYFIEHMHCSPTIRGLNGYTLLHMATAGGHLDIVKYLIEIQHCDPMIMDAFNHTPIDVAEQYDQVHVVTYYFENLDYSLSVQQSLLDTHTSKDMICNSKQSYVEETSSLDLALTHFQQERDTAKDILYMLSTTNKRTSYNAMYEKTSNIEQLDEDSDNVQISQ